MLGLVVDVIIGRYVESDEGSSSIVTADLANRMYSQCGHGSVTLTNGRWQQDATQPELGTVEGFGEQFGDVTADGQPEAIVTFACTTGAGTVSPYVVVLTMSDGEARTIGEFDGYAPTVNESNGRGISLIVSTDHYAETDPLCCPSSRDEVTYTLDGFKLAETESQTFPND